MGYGKSLNGAQISEKHNFLINKDNASAADLKQLGENIEQKCTMTLGGASLGGGALGDHELF